MSRREQHSYSSWCFSGRAVCGWRHCKHCPNQTESVALGYHPVPPRQTFHQICPTCNGWFTVLDWLKDGRHGKLLRIEIVVFLGGWLFLCNPRWCAIFMWIMNDKNCMYWRNIKLYMVHIIIQWSKDVNWPETYHFLTFWVPSKSLGNILNLFMVSINSFRSGWS